MEGERPSGAATTATPTESLQLLNDTEGGSGGGASTGLNSPMEPGTPGTPPPEVQQQRGEGEAPMEVNSEEGKKEGKKEEGSSSGSSGEGRSSGREQSVKKVELEIAPTTGGSFNFVIDPEESIEGLKKAIGKKLKVGKEHICLLHRDRLLESSKRIRDYGLADGSRVSLVPSVETGLLTQRPEQSVLEALEGLNESQVGDFLSGKSPLNLTMRLGDHVMLIQLQLSKGSKGHTSCSSSSSVPSSSSSSSSSRTEPPRPRSAPPPPPAPSTPPPEKPSTSAAAAAAAATPLPPDPTKERLNTLAEASRNLSNTLKKLSSHVIKEDDDSITNHMQHHGKGVYSGTFSGTLNPALQDNSGKPKKHVSTIIHILNDLLGGMDPSKCTHISTGTPTSPVSPGSSLSTDLHNKRRQLRRRQPENGGTPQKKSESASSSNQDPTKRSRYTSPGTPEGCASSCSSDHHYHRCRAAAPAEPKETREQENEQLRLKMERLKESLRLRKEKMMMRNSRGGPSSGPSPPPTPAS